MLFGLAGYASIMFAVSCTHKRGLQNVPETCSESEDLPVFLNGCAISGCHDGSGKPDRALDSPWKATLKGSQPAISVVNTYLTYCEILIRLNQCILNLLIDL